MAVALTGRMMAVEPTGTPEPVFYQCTDTVRTVRWWREKSPENVNKVIVGTSGELENEIRVHEVDFSFTQGKKPKEEHLKKPLAIKKCLDVSDIQFVDDRGKFVAGNSDGDLVLYQCEEKKIKELERKTGLHKARVSAIRVEQPNSSKILSVCEAGDIILSDVEYELKSGEKRNAVSIKCPIHAVTWAKPDDFCTEFYTAGLGARLIMWDVRTLKPVTKFSCGTPSFAFTSCAAQRSGEGSSSAVNMVVAGSDEGVLQLWDPRKTEPLASHPLHDAPVW
eukprot:CAMPEP_0114525160 /NCGR_PEP_ID=MMETSP0109-20121206/22261_1 /TAXON_ID=29199 /ORGANISM="Chlorarachnion reptans, Strain CCCM449" /LENGTH=278 /DNA_ID=CAMNT_0001706693 /DNA_START=6 /DNA_END=839 /DNA_ORIENTATION=-